MHMMFGYMSNLVFKPFFCSNATSNVCVIVQIYHNRQRSKQIVKRGSNADYVSLVNIVIVDKLCYV